MGRDLIKRVPSVRAGNTTGNGRNRYLYSKLVFECPSPESKTDHPCFPHHTILESMFIVLETSQLLARSEEMCSKK